MNHNTTVIGTCSLCGGRVTVPTFYHSILPPTPQCESCGAVPAEPHGPVIPMRPVRTWTTTGTNWNPNLGKPTMQ